MRHDVVSRRLLEECINELTAERSPKSYLHAAVSAAASLGAAPSRSTNRHAAWCHEFFLVSEGKARLATPGGDIELNPGQLLLISPGVEHEELPATPGAPYVLSCFMFDQSWMGLFRVNYTPSQGQVYPAAPQTFGGEPLESVVAAIAWELSEKRPGWPEAVQDLMTYLKRALLRRVNSGNYARQRAQIVADARTVAVIDTALRYCAANLGRTLRLTDAAAAVGYSPRHLSRVLSRHLGKPFCEHVRDLRIGTATDLLTESDLSIAEVAEHVGYRDRSHFTRAFRQVTGVPPRVYRRTHRAS